MVVMAYINMHFPSETNSLRLHFGKDVKQLNIYTVYCLQVDNVCTCIVIYSTIHGS